MTREEAIKRLKEARTTIQPFLYVDEAIDYVVEALEQEPCEDAISRQAVLDAIWQKEYGKDYDGINTLNIRHIDIIEKMPSVTPQSETGHWWERNTYLQECRCWDCSECQETVFERTNYCPNCGVKMVEP